MEQQYQSGMGKRSVLPRELRGWNWGAFFLNWIWGIGNNTWIALLMFVPFVNFVMLFVLGAKGNEWAWQNNLWRDTNHFRQVQRKWALAGVVVLALSILLFVGLFSLIGNLMKGEAYELSLKTVKSHPEVIELIGQPIEQNSFVMGNIKINGAQGTATLNYTITGPKGSAKVYVAAEKDVGPWELKKLLVHSPRHDKKIQIIPAPGQRI